MTVLKTFKNNSQFLSVLNKDFFQGKYLKMILIYLLIPAL